MSIEDGTAITGLAHARRGIEHIERLCEFGDRFAGQPGDRLAADYVDECLRSYGLSVTRSQAAVVTFKEKRCSLVLEDGTAVDAISAYYSPSTPGVLEAPLVYVGDGTEESYAGKDVEGAVAVFEETQLGFDLFWLGALAERAAAHGAVAIVIFHPFPWSYRPSMEFGTADLHKRFAEPGLPTVAISATGALRVMAAMASEHPSVKMEVATEMLPCTSDHVIGVIRGTTYPEEKVIVLAHRDSPIPPGANDNGSGTATILEIARLLCSQPAERSMVFLSAAAEEGRAEGVAQYVEALGDDIRSVKAAISIDMIAVGGPLRMVDWAQWPDRTPMQFSQWLMEMLEDAADRLGYQLERCNTGAAADAGRFLDAGVSTAWFWKPDDFRYHSREDKPENVDGNVIKAAAEITATTMVAVANGARGVQPLAGRAL